MPSFNFVDIFPDYSYFVGRFGDWEDEGTLRLSFAQEGGRFSDALVYELFSAGYPNEIPLNATVTSLRIFITANTTFAIADLRCALSVNGNWSYASALSNNVSSTLQTFVFDFSNAGLINDFLAANGGVNTLNYPDFGCALFSGGSSAGDLENESMFVSAPRMEIDFNTLDGEYITTYRRRRRT